MIIDTIQKETYTFEIIPSIFNEGIVYDISIRDEQRNKITYNDVSSNAVNINDIINVSFNVDIDYFQENCFYNIEFKYVNEIVYKAKVFITSQVISDYSINKDKFEFPTITNNEYISL
jgi:hypothetical protein